MIHLREARLSIAGDRAGFPFDLPALRGVRALRFDAPVTLLVGENGSGKSTVLEALAIASRAITAGSAEAADDPSLEGVRALARAMSLTWATRTHRGFFMRAEDFFGYAKRMDRLRADLVAGLAAVDEAYADRRGSLAHELARTPWTGELAALGRRYGDGLDGGSHGESLLRFLRERLVPGGLYLLDEPEAPLSPARQLALVALLRDVVAAGSQAIVATHSPILLAFPDAAIWSFDGADGIGPVAYEDLEHVRLTRDFLANPGAFLRHL